MKHQVPNHVNFGMYVPELSFGGHVQHACVTKFGFSAPAASARCMAATIANSPMRTVAYVADAIPDAAAALAKSAMARR
jgi:hypothetical protein